MPCDVMSKTNMYTGFYFLLQKICSQQGAFAKIHTEFFSLQLRVQTGSGAYPISKPMVTEGSFPRG